MSHNKIVAGCGHHRTVSSQVTHSAGFSTLAKGVINHQEEGVDADLFNFHK